MTNARRVTAFHNKTETTVLSYSLVGRWLGDWLGDTKVRYVRLSRGIGIKFAAAAAVCHTGINRAVKLFLCMFRKLFMVKSKEQKQGFRLEANVVFSLRKPWIAGCTDIDRNGVRG